MARVDRAPTRAEQIEQEAAITAAQRMLLAKGAAEWDERRFFDAHETWEELWMNEPRPIRSFFQGLILLAAGLHHWTGTHKPRGVQTKLAAGIERLAPYAPAYLGVDVSGMIGNASALLREAAGLDADRLATTSAEMFPPFRWRHAAQTPDAYVLALVHLDDLTEQGHHQFGMFDNLALAQSPGDLFAGMPLERDPQQLPLQGGLTIGRAAATDAESASPRDRPSETPSPISGKPDVVRMGDAQTALWHQEADALARHLAPAMVAYGSIRDSMQLGLWRATIPELLVRRIRPTARLPERATTLSSGLDLYADLGGDGETLRLDAARGVVPVPTGVSISLPPGFDAQIRPRSGLWRAGVEVGFGTIDADYRGELIVQAALRAGGEGYTIRHADRIAQLVVAHAALPAVVEVDALDDTARGEGGFGSTGR